MHCFKRCTLALVVIVVMIWASTLAGLLDSSDQPRKVDAIVVLGGDAARILEGAELYRAGYAPRILLSRPAREKRFELLEQEGVPYPWFEVAGRAVLQRRGVPEAAVGEFGDRLVSTVAEARTIARDHPQLKSILLVTSPFHVYRARMIFRDQLPGVEILGVGSRYEPFDPNWWHDPEMTRHAIMETIKLAFYWSGGRR
jgi:uncharacterized SAM-binding protein YcdF (DUF218 family)